MTDGMRIYKVSYHGGSMCALVETETPERAAVIAKAHREAKRVFSGHPPREVLEDRYDVAPATERDVAWARKFRVGVLTDMPMKPRKGAPRSHKRETGTPPRARGRMVQNALTRRALHDHEMEQTMTKAKDGAGSLADLPRDDPATFWDTDDQPTREA